MDTIHADPTLDGMLKQGARLGSIAYWLNVSGLVVFTIMFATWIKHGFPDVAGFFHLAGWLLGMCVCATNLLQYEVELIISKPTQSRKARARGLNGDDDL